MDPILNSTSQNETCDSINSAFSNIKTVKIVHNPSSEPLDNTFVRNAMDTYLKKHKLDLTLLPNKKIKLSDLRSSLSHASNNKSESSTLSQEPAVQAAAAPTNSSVVDPLVDGSSSNTNDSIESTEQSENELNDEIDDVQAEDLNGIAATVDVADADAEGSTGPLVEKKRSRKKREPSLKLQQKLSNEDLEMIVSNVRSLSANVSIADVKKDNYVDKILKVELLDSDIV